MTLGGRANGKTSRMLAGIREALNRGEHVHVAGKRTGLTCIEGPASCPLQHRTLTQLEQDLRR